MERKAKVGDGGWKRETAFVVEVRSMSGHVLYTSQSASRKRLPYWALDAYLWLVA